MVAAVRVPSVSKRFLSDTFAPPVGFSADIRGSEVSVAEILAGGVRESDWSFPILASTPSRDRQGDVVEAEGCDYRAFARSPIFFFDHQELKFPVGSLRGPDGRIYFAIVPGKGILGRVWIRKPQPDDPPAYAEACKTIWILVRDGLINGISAGFDPVGSVKEFPDGGFLYKKWELLELSAVPIAANRECRVIREQFSWDEAILKRFSPSVIKGLRSMSIAKDHHNTHDIKYRNGEWVILDNKTRKPLSTHKTREEAVAAMRALQVFKSMSQSSGSAGGYTVPEEHKAMCKSIADRMSDEETKGHSLHFNPNTGELHHSYPDGESQQKVKSIAADLHDAPGVKSVTQEPESRPNGDGFHKIYPHKDEDDMVEEGHKGRVQKGAKFMSAIGKSLFHMVQKRKLNGWIGKSLELRARQIMPRLLKLGVREEKAICVAWGIAGTEKGLAPLVVKDMADDEDDKNSADEAQDMADDAATDAAMDVPEDEASGGPDGLELVQTAIENLEAALPKLEPELRKFWQGIIQQIRDHGETRYPNEDFGGEDTAGEEDARQMFANDATEQAESNKMLARYKNNFPRRNKNGRPERVNRISVAKVLKSLQAQPEHEDPIRKAANHLHEIGDMPAKFDKNGGYLEGFTPSHRKHCRIKGRGLDEVLGGMTKDEKPRGKPTEDDTTHDAGEFDVNEIGPVVKSLSGDADAARTLREVEERQKNFLDRINTMGGLRS